MSDITLAILCTIGGMFCFTYLVYLCWYKPKDRYVVQRTEEKIKFMNYMTKEFDIPWWVAYEEYTKFKTLEELKKVNKRLDKIQKKKNVYGQNI